MHKAASMYNSGLCAYWVNNSLAVETAVHDRQQARLTTVETPALVVAAGVAAVVAASNIKQMSGCSRERKCDAVGQLDIEKLEVVMKWVS